MVGLSASASPSSYDSRETTPRIQVSCWDLPTREQPEAYQTRVWSHMGLGRAKPTSVMKRRPGGDPPWHTPHSSPLRSIDSPSRPPRPPHGCDLWCSNHSTKLSTPLGIKTLKFCHQLGHSFCVIQASRDFLVSSFMK